MKLLRLALRGLSRNWRRSLVTLLAIAFGFAAISLFAGYTHNVYDGLSRQAIHSEMLGHLTLSKRGMSRQGKLDPERYLLNADDIERIRSLLQDEPHVKLIAPRLTFNGLLSNGSVSTIFIADGIEPQAMQALQEGFLTEAEAQSGAYANYFKHLDETKPEVVALAAGLAELLHLPLDGLGAMLVNTLSGQVNATDVVVGSAFNTGNAGSNDKYAFVSLALVQSLLDADGRADRLTILLDDVRLTKEIGAKLRAQLAADPIEWEVQTWQELSAFYNQVRDMFDLIFGFIFGIVLTVVVMSVANSMGMTVVERTREIGTLRAIGLERRNVVWLFGAESLVLGAAGCLVGLLLMLLVRYGINAAQISYTPPNSSNPIPLLVDMDSQRMFLTLLLIIAVGSVAALLPARRAARQPIIDALGHV